MKVYAKLKYYMVKYRSNPNSKVTFRVFSSLDEARPYANYKFNSGCINVQVCFIEEKTLYIPE